MKKSLNSVFSIGVLILYSTLTNAQSSVNVNLSQFESSVGAYRLDPSDVSPGLGAGVCQYGSRELNLSFDLAKNQILLNLRQSNEGGLDQVLAYTVNLEATSSNPCLTCESESRVVVSGRAIVTQTQSYDVFGGPWQKRQWLDDPGFLIHFVSETVVEIPFETIPCRYVKVK